MSIRVFAFLLPIVVASASAGQGDDPAPLAGPEVREVRPDLLEQGLTAGPMTGMSMGQTRQLPASDFTDLLRRLDSDEVEWTMRFSDRQRDRLDAVRRTHQTAVREYRREHAETFRDLRERAGYNADPRVPDDKVGADVMEARLALRALYQRGPTAADLQTKLYAELTGAQQDWVDAEIGRLIEEQSRERRERRYADELAASPVDPSTFFEDDGTVNMDALPERLRRQMSEFEEPQRANRLRRIVERVSRIRLESGESEPMADRAAPGIDAVQVPKPD
ncbi:MAG: hypothetical protein AAFS11_00010 [Planctomycetota bacterium]